MPTQKTEGKGPKENCSTLRLTHLRVYGNGMSFQVVCAQSSFLCPYVIWLRVLSCCMWISQITWNPAQRFLGDWQNISWACVSSLRLAPPKLSCLVVACCSMFLIGTSCWERTRASSYYHAWLAKKGGFGQWFPVDPFLTSMCLCNLCIKWYT